MALFVVNLGHVGRMVYRALLVSENSRNVKTILGSPPAWAFFSQKDDFIALRRRIFL